jgi:hypothetical protein
MKKRVSLLCALILIVTASGWAQFSSFGSGVILGGVTSGPLGDGSKGDQFSRGLGFFGEFYFTLGGITYVFGVNAAYAKNTYASHSVDVTLWVPFYFDMRFNLISKRRFVLFTTFGIGVSAAKFANLAGYVQDMLLSFGLGAKFALSRGMFLQTALKPYFLINAGDHMGLDPKFGLEGSLGIGFAF